METRLTHEGLEILNAILPKIDPHAKFFNVTSIYAPVLKEKYPRQVNGVVTGLYDKAIKELKPHFDNVTNWLIQQGFADENKPPSSIYIDLKLSKLGEVLWAYESVEKYYKSVEASSPVIVSARIEEIIKMAYRYGEFTIIQKIPQTRVVNLNIFNSNDGEELQKINNIISGKTDIIDLYEQAKVDEEAIGYLIAEGFATNKHDIKDNSSRLYRQLTDRGRKLKEFGSIRAFEEWEARENEQERVKTETEREYIQKQNEFVEVNKKFTAKQSELIDNQTATNLISQITNKYIAIFTGVTGLYSISELMKTYLPAYMEHRRLFMLIVLFACGFAGIIGYRQINRISQRKEREV